MGASQAGTDRLAAWQWKIFFANYLGLIFEAYDLTIYSLLVVPVSQYFHVPVWYGFLVLTMTYVFRGLGGLLFGHIGDKMGRRNALIFTVLGYSICTALTGLSWSVTSLIVWRGLTGLFIGGEYVGYSYTMEAVPKRTRGGFSGLLVSSYSVGFLLASATFGVVAALTGAHFVGGGWRWPFFIGILPALIALWMRVGVQESQAWLKVQESNKSRPKVPFFEVFKRRYIGRTVHAWLLMAGLIWSYDVLLLAMPRLLSFLKLPSGTIASLSFIMNVGSLLGAILGGFACQKWGRRPAIIGTAVIGIITTPLFVPMFAGAHPSYAYLAVFSFIGAIFAEAGFGMMPAYLSERYPTEVRATGATGTYNLGQIIAGWSTTLLAAVWGANVASFERGMVINAIVAFAIVIVLAAIGKETREVDLDTYNEAAELKAGGIPVGPAPAKSR